MESLHQLMSLVAIARYFNFVFDSGEQLQVTAF